MDMNFPQTGLSQVLRINLFLQSREPGMKKNPFGVKYNNEWYLRSSFDTEILRQTLHNRSQRQWVQNNVGFATTFCVLCGRKIMGKLVDFPHSFLTPRYARQAESLTGRSPHWRSPPRDRDSVFFLWDLIKINLREFCVTQVLPFPYGGSGMLEYQEV